MWQTKIIKKQESIAVLTSENVEFNPNPIRRVREGHYLFIIGKMYQERITVLNIYVPNERVYNFIKEILLHLKQQIGPNTITVNDFNTHFTHTQVIQIKCKQKLCS